MKKKIKERRLAREKSKTKINFIKKSRERKNDERSKNNIFESTRIS